MKPINEITTRLSGVFLMVFLLVFGDECGGQGWVSLMDLGLMLLASIVLGSYVANFLEVFKKWWKE